MALFNLGGISAANETINITNTSDIQQNDTNSTTNTTDSNIANSINTTNIQNSTKAAAGSSYSKVKGIWIRSDSVNTLNVTILTKLGITDVFVKTNLPNQAYQNTLNTILAKLQGTGIRVHAWITCFQTTSSNGTTTWVDPANQTQQDFLINSITDIVKNYNVDGIHLDYVRYPGTKGNEAGTSGTAVITSFVQLVYETVKSINSSVAVSAALMPEGSVNDDYYGQNYTQLSQYLDFLVPMIYKGNYGYNSSTGTSSSGASGKNWIGSTVAYIVSQANGKPVVAGLQTYRSDSNVTPIPASELQNDMDTAIGNGSSGYALFRYGLINSQFITDTVAPTIKSIDPANKAINIPITKVIKVTFSESIKMGNGWIELKDSSGKTISFTTSISGNVLTVTPSINLVKGTGYTLTLHSGSLKDLSGNNLVLCGSTFTTDSTAPTIKSVDPTNKAVNVPVNKVIKVTFSESIKTGNSWIELKNSAGKAVLFTTSISGNVLTATPSSNLVKGTKYTLTLHSGSLIDLSGNNLVLCGSTFTTDNTAPTIKNVDPANKAVNVPVNKVIKVTFSESIKMGNSWIELKDSSGKAISFNTSISGNVLTVTPSSNLVKGTKYTLTLHSGSLIDLSGNNLVLCGSTFTTSTVQITAASTSSQLQQYLQATANCQVNDPSIKALAASITKGKTSTYDKAVTIYNWARDKLGYSFYYNTKYGATGTLAKMTGNCCDTAHLVVALERAAGIPARYEHVYAKFSSGSWYGHVISQVYVNGKWYNADATSYGNSFGVINNWNTATATYYGTYASLPF